MKDKISITIDKQILKGLDHVVDGIKIRNRSQAIEAILNKSLGINKIAVILSGGSVNSLRIEDTYRPLVKIKGKTLVERNIERLKKYNFNEVFIIAKKEILAHIINVLGDGSKYNIKIHYVEDSGEGSAKSVSLLKNKVKTTFLVVPGDNEFNMDLNQFWQSHLKNKGVMTFALTTSNDPTALSIVGAEGDKIKKFIHFKDTTKLKKDKSNLVWSGIYISEPEFFSYIGKDDKSTEKDVTPKVFNDGSLYGYIFSGHWFNIHTLEDLRNAERNTKE